MLRMYSIMQLGNLWVKPANTTADSILTDDILDEEDDDDGDISIMEVHPVAVETTNIQEQQEEPVTTGYQAKNKTDHQLYQYSKYTLNEENGSTSSTPTTTASSSSFSISTSSDPGIPSNHFRYNKPTTTTTMTTPTTSMHEEHQKTEDDSIKKNNYYYYYHHPSYSSSHHHQRTHFNRPVLQQLQIHPPYMDDLPPLTYDLTCITEEDQTEVNDSSQISSSTGSLPKTPTSTVSTPLRRKRPEIKFNERRKNFAKKLKRVFTSKSNSKHRNST